MDPGLRLAAMPYICQVTLQSDAFPHRDQANVRDDYRRNCDSNQLEVSNVKPGKRFSSLFLHLVLLTAVIMAGTIHIPETILTCVLGPTQAQGTKRTLAEH